MWIRKQKQDSLPAATNFRDQPLGGKGQCFGLVVEAVEGRISNKFTQDFRCAGFDGVVLLGELVGGLEMD